MIGAMPHGWTPERTDRLKTLWAEGYSASQIAAQLGGVTRNGVISKVHRLGLNGRGQPTAPGNRRVIPPDQRKRAIASVSRPSTAVAKPRAVIPPMRQPANPVRLLDRNMHSQCPFPLWDGRPGEDAMVCGAQLVGNYCEDHERLCEPGRQRVA